MKKPILLILLLFTVGVTMSFGQKKISGVVTDEQNQPLIGATVLVKGTDNGTVTDVNGKYTIVVPDEKATLVFSYVGYLSENMAVDGKSTVNISLVPDITGLDEVVVIGYGSVKKKDLTGAVASVSANQLKDIPITSTAQAITGRLAGVQITTSEGSPDASVKVRVRGGGSITQDNSPLYIVDGFPVDDLSGIAPSDIASIDVLKDASSTAIYGSRGANGVVIITTKSGRKNHTTVNYNFSYGLKKIEKKLDVLSPLEYAKYQYEWAAAQGAKVLSTFNSAYGNWDQFDSLYGGQKGTDWQGQAFGQRAPTMQNSISISGGSEKSTYNLSYTNDNYKGIMLGSGYKRNTLNFRFTTKATKRLTVDFNARYANISVLGSGTSDAGTTTTNKLRAIDTYRPVDGISSLSTSQLLDITNQDATSGLVNPIDLINDDYEHKKTDDLNFNASLTYNIIKGLNMKSEAGYYTKGENDDHFYGLNTSLARKYADEPVVRLKKNNESKIRWANTLTFSRDKIAGVHDITLLLGQELIATNTNDFNQEIHSFPPPITHDLALGMLQQGTDPLPSTSQIDQDRLFSLFGRAMYSYRDKYLASFSLRTDGSSKFRSGKHWGYFPSASVAWRISEEPFMQNIAAISSMKLRFSYGASGNNRIDNNLFLQSFESSNSKQYYLNQNAQPYIYKKNIANPGLEWETTITRDGGLDIGLFRNRINANFDYYYNTTRDLLIEEPIQANSGYSYENQNIGETRNLGFEAVLNAYIIERENFTLSANFNISFNRNKVISLGDVPGGYKLYSSGWNNDIGADYIVEVGQPVGLMYGYISDGFYTINDFNYDAATQTYTLKPGVADNSTITFQGNSFGPGSMKFKKLPGDTTNVVSSSYDRTIIGNANPKHIGGMNIMMSFRGIDFSLFLNWVYGNNIYNANKIELSSGYYEYTNLLNIMNSSKRWRTVNDAGDVVTDPTELAALNKNATIWKPNTGRYLFTSWAVEDGSFLRINNVTLGYTLPRKWIKKIQKFRLYVTANNLYTFTKYTGYDPEVDTRRSTPMTPGVDYSAYPRSRMYTFGLNVTL